MIQEIGFDADNQSEDSMRTIFCVEHDGSVMTNAEYLTTMKNSGGNPEQVTADGTTAQVWGSRRPSQGSTTRDLPLVHADEQVHRRGGFIDTGIFKNQTWVCGAAEATLLQPRRSPCSRCVCSCSILSTTVNRGLSVLSRPHSNRYQGRKENRYEGDD